MNFINRKCEDIKKKYRLDVYLNWLNWFISKFFFFVTFYFNENNEKLFKFNEKDLIIST